MIPVLAGCATIPSRKGALANVLRAICPQVAVLSVYHDDTGRVSFWGVDHDGSLVESEVHANEEPGWGDAGKFWFTIRKSFKVDEPFYFIGLDDDLFYPDDYVSVMLDGLKMHRNQVRSSVGSQYNGVLVSAHGRRWKRKKPFQSYYRDPATKYRCLGTVAEDTEVHTAGTGVCAFWGPDIKMGLPDFLPANMADIHMAGLCRAQNVKQVVLAHEEGWIRHQPVDMKETIFHRYKNNDRLQTRWANKYRLWDNGT